MKKRFYGAITGLICAIIAALILFYIGNGWVSSILIILDVVVVGYVMRSFFNISVSKSISSFSYNYSVCILHHKTVDRLCGLTLVK
jgi:hypothetical protein